MEIGTITGNITCNRVLSTILFFRLQILDKSAAIHPITLCLIEEMGILLTVIATGHFHTATATVPRRLFRCANQRPPHTLPMIQRINRHRSDPAKSPGLMEQRYCMETQKTDDVSILLGNQHLIRSPRTFNQPPGYFILTHAVAQRRDQPGDGSGIIISRFSDEVLHSPQSRFSENTSESRPLASNCSRRVFGRSATVAL